MTSFRWAASLALLAASCAAPSNLPAPRVSGLPAPHVVPGSLEARPLLGDLPLRAARAGAGPLAIVATGTMAEGERLGAFVDVPADACLLAYGRAAASLEDIDLAAFAEDGTPVVVDEGPDPKPTLLVCPPHPDRVYVAAHAATGEGLCVIGAQLVPRDRSAEVARTAAAKGAIGGATKSPEAWPGLEDQVRAHRASLGGSWDEVRRVAITVDSKLTSTAAFNVEAGGCTSALVVPEEDVALVDLDVTDAEGRLVARAKESGNTRSVTVCSPISLAGSVQIRPHVGRGLVAVVVSRATGDGAKDFKARPETAWVTPSAPLEVTRTARNAALAKVGYGAPSSTQSGQLSLGRRATVPIDLGGGCSRIDVVAGTPLALVDGAVWDDAGNLLGQGDGADGATMFACGRGKARVDLGTQGRPGPYALLVRPEPWKDPAFAGHPLAAGRMLSRAASGPGAVHEGAPLSVRHVTLESTKQHVDSASIPAGKCLRAAFGVSGEGSGIEVRLFDVVTGEELDRSHGQSAAGVRACADANTRSVRVEARATAGKLDAIVGLRVSPSKP